MAVGRGAGCVGRPTRRGWGVRAHDRAARSQDGRAGKVFRGGEDRAMSAECGDGQNQGQGDKIVIRHALV